ncbi:amino acid adenylation domain-containing protein [Streptomyces sp. NPDC059629]|uniref:non-ribosomal peptide synthetase n=1 Tax=Streptomyces sp. NPDC059629 TaxID=3346889 RepID=UPI0036C496EE
MTETPVRRQELIELLLRGRGAPEGTVAQSAERARLSRDQQRLWFLEQRYPGTAQNNIAFRLDLADAPDRAELERVLTRLQDMHQALRLSVSGPPDAPVQEVSASCTVPLDWHDLTSHAPSPAQERADELAADAARRPLDLSKPPLYRASAMLLPDGSWRLVLVFHHLVVDGWSAGVVFEDLARLLSGKEAKHPATSFVDWVARHYDEAAPDWVRDYWAGRFVDAPVASTLALREGAVIDVGLRGGLIPFEIDAALARDLRSLAGRLGVTVHAVCLAAFKVVLRRFANSSAVVVGSPIAGREDPVLDRVVGFFVRTLALRTDIALDDSFADVARRVHQVVIEALDHQPMPFDELVALTGTSGAESANPLFRTMFAYLGAAAGAPKWKGRLRGARDLDTGTAKFDLTLALTEHAEGMSGGMEWAERGTDELAAGGALEAFLAILRLVVRQPEVRVEAIGLTELPVREQSAPEHVGAGRLSLADGLFRQAELTPQGVALIDERDTLDYAGLADRVARTAEELRRRGLRPGDRVALLLERSVDLVVGVHAVTAAGCGYVPIDTTAPPARIAELLAAADVGLVLCHEPTRALLPDGAWPTLDAAVSLDASIPAPRRTTPARAGDSAYLLFTSGSTGRPKLVAFPTDASQAFLDWMQSTMPLGSGDRVLLKTPYGFDVSVWELFWPLRHGASLVVATPTGHADPAYLAALIQRERVTVVNFVPSVLEYFLEQPGAGDCTTLRYLLSAGEALTPSLQNRVLHRLPAAALVNLYGPTETGAVTAHTCVQDRAARSVPIGAALPHTRLHVLDENLLPVPPGLRGELYIGGELGTAIGYWGQPALTAERFVPDPFSAEPGRRLYRTGDGARRLPDGGYEYLGRLDRQVKLHGVRIEPAEIEAALVAHPSVTSVRVLLLGQDEAAELVAFYTVDHGTAVEPDALRGWAVTRLPRQLVPRTLLALPQLPLNTNGKTDANALAAVWRDNRAEQWSSTADAARDPVEQRIHAAFEEVLGHGVSDRESTFFELGGNSMLLLRLAAVLERRTGFSASIADLTNRPTVALLAELLGSRSASSGLLVPLAGAVGAPKLLLLPPASGSALPYLPLGRELAPAFDVMGCNAPGFAGTPPRTVPDFVAELLPTVAREVAEGPCVLAGWSFGGVLAYELGVALSLRGIRPAAVVMFDSWVPVRGGEPSADGADGIAFLREHGLVPDGLSAPDLRALTTMVAATTEAFSTYRPSRAADFPVHLIRAAHGYPGIVDAGYDDRRGWADVVPQLHVSEVAADHFELLGPTAIHELARQLRSVTVHDPTGDHPSMEGHSR